MYNILQARRFVTSCDINFIISFLITSACTLKTYSSVILKISLNILFIQPLSPQENLRIVIQGEGPVILPETVEELRVLEFSVLVTNCKKERPSIDVSVHASGTRLSKCSQGLDQLI